MCQVSPYAGDWIRLPSEVMLKLWSECWGISLVVIWGRADMRGAHCADSSVKKSTMAAVQCGKVVEGGCAAVRVEPLDEGVGRFAIRLAMVEV